MSQISGWSILWNGFCEVRLLQRIRFLAALMFHEVRTATSFTQFIGDTIRLNTLVSQLLVFMFLYDF